MLLSLLRTFVCVFLMAPAGTQTVDQIRDLRQGSAGPPPV
jgi:hypothetical protein